MGRGTLVSLLLAVTLSAVAQLSLKVGMSSAPVTKAMSQGLLAAANTVMSTPLVWAGLGLYVLSVALWLWVLAHLDLSVAYPFVGLSFIVTMLFGAFILHEDVTWLRAAGTVMIATGCVLVAQSS